MTLPGVVAPVETGVSGAGTVGPPSNRFHIAAVAFQRERQLRNGARPRVDAAGHKSCFVAVLEVMADRVSWYVPA
jgi:DNA-directed RNA polymerase subunit K/omega